MKKINIILVLLTISFSAMSQIAYNPFTQNIHFEPEPTAAGFECGTVQTVAFTQGLTTADDATGWVNDPLTVTICLTGFKFNGPASSAVTGSYSVNFDWVYDSFAPNCIVGTQKQTLPGTGTNPLFPNPLSSGDIKLSLLVPETSPISTVLAVNVNLQVPGYMSQFNTTPDDNESTQTQTFCSLKIKGNVYNDTSSDVHVNGMPIYNPDDSILYANLIGPSGDVVATVPIGTDGKYEFTNITPNTTYSVVLSMIEGTVGSPAPAVILPSTWVNTGEDCCDKINNDGNANGVITVVVNQATAIDVNFGIKNPFATPLVLKNFFVNEYHCGALLSWTTSQEQNTSHVEIYRKDNKSSAFRKIAQVMSAGSSQTEKLYSYHDKDIKQQEEAYEYELKFVDIDGQWTKSEIRTLKLNCNQSNTGMNMYPNPATKELNLIYVTESDKIELEVEILDMMGRRILEGSHTATNGSTIMHIDISSISTGTYVLRYHDMEGLTHGSVKFMKQ